MSDKTTPGSDELELKQNDSNAEKVSEATADLPGCTPEGTRFFGLVFSLHLSLVLVNAGQLFFYFQRSWELEHYRFFPFALFVFVGTVYSRIETGRIREGRLTPIVCLLFLIMSFVCFLLSVLQYNQYLPAVGVCFAMGSLLFCLSDKETEGSLLPAWLLLLPLIRIPLNFDITLIAELQFFSSAFASNVLDFLGISNYTPGTIIQVAQQGTETGVKKFDVERACSGVQSIYTLLFCTLTVAVWGRRSFIAGFLLVLSGVFWSITMNGIRIVVCVAFYFWFDVDVYSGFKHEILGYLILFCAIGLVASTDAVISFVLSPIDVVEGSRNIFAKAWNRMVTGAQLFKHRTAVTALSSFAAQVVRGVVLTALAAVNIAAVCLLIISLTSGNLKGSFKVGALNLVEDDIPDRIQGQSLDNRRAEGKPVSNHWNLLDGSFKNTRRNSNSTYGPNSSIWVYLGGTSSQIVQVSLDYTFLGWHELKICYKSSGWKVDRAIVPHDQWKSVELHLSKDNGETGYCIFSIFDYRGEPVEPLSDNLGFFLLRLKNRISREFSTTTSFQTQCFIQSFDEISKERIESVKQLHLMVREKTRALVLERIGSR
ncbi:MAG: exosortase U [Planctomycetota bacterium]|nr:exosortase U [Planctomycetota bacterium]